MIVHFLLDFREELHESMDDIETKVVETYEDPERPGYGYEMIEVEVPLLGAVQTVCGDKSWFAAEADSANVDGKDVFVVTAWEELK